MKMQKHIKHYLCFSFKPGVMFFYRNFAKPVIDTTAAVLILLLCVPVLMPVTLLLAVANSGKVFFLQRRPGYKARPFYIIKFKTMRDLRDGNGTLLPDGHRLTRIGGWARSWSLDELPQLINVIKGDMSFVGPRPLLMEYLPLYDTHQNRRHEVKPGITGWAQVKGRNALNWPDKFELDVEYVDRQSFLFDLRILLLTAGRVISRKGISSASSATIEPFTGKQQMPPHQSQRIQTPGP